MLCDVEWAEDGTYVPGEEFSPERFFNDGLMNSTEFDLKLGYFSSAAISVLAEGFATFISRGGFMRLIINHIVSPKDKEAITDGLMGNVIDCTDLSNFQYLKTTFDEYQEQFFRCLAYMISQKRIDIRIIRPHGKKGIAHTKTGQFRDGDSVTAFTGSANFTISGLFNNIEDINIVRSDSLDVMVQNRIAKQKKDFDSIMFGEKKGIDYLSPKDLVEAINCNYGDPDIEELLDVENKLKAIRNRQQEEKTHCVHEDIPVIEPHFPFDKPRDYQIEAFENWKNNGQKGLFAMATGTGKTITSLNCLLEIYKRNGYYKAIILVPTITLVNQWEKECWKFNFGNIIKVYSKNAEWRSKVDLLQMAEKYRKPSEPTQNFVIISTYASFARENVFSILNCFERTKVLLIADEAHNMGSPSILKRLGTINYLRRIGLSATPERQFDDDTNKKLYKFFGADEKFTFEYSMEEAIQKGVLCKYYYYPHLVKLTDEEMANYIDLSEKISKYFNYNSGEFDKKDEILMGLLLARKRIIHKAANKLGAFKKIIEERYEKKGNLKYSLIYVPEGNKPDYFSDSDVFDKSEQVPDDIISDHLIDVYTEAVMKIDKYITVRKFVSGQKDRDAVLADFAKGKLQVLTSMKCLDEGVDVPRSELAIFCASTGNPRQFIQRRGRVLRTHPDKYMAEIHDLVVAPEVSTTSSSYKMEQSLLKGELMRVKNFSMLSENPSYSQMELKSVMEHYGLNMYNNDHIV
jgi:superfamily II DNA or RNA helicase